MNDEELTQEELEQDILPPNTFPEYKEYETYFPSGEYLQFPSTVDGDNFVQNYLDTSKDYNYLRNIATDGVAEISALQLYNVMKLNTYEQIQTRNSINVLMVSFITVTLVGFFLKKFKAV